MLEVVQVNNTGNPIQDLDFFRTLPNGSREPSAFRVPLGQAFVITDVDWQYNNGTGGGIQTLRIFIGGTDGPPPDPGFRVFESTIMLNGQGSGGISEDMTTGCMVGQGGRIRVDSFPGGGVISHILVRGYLIPA